MRDNWGHVARGLARSWEYLTWTGYNRVHLSDFDGAMLVYTDFLSLQECIRRGTVAKETQGLKEQ